MKKDNYKINQDFKPLSSEQIEAHKDFDKLLENFNTTAQPETPEAVTGAPRRWIYPVLAIAAVGLIGVLMIVLNPTSKADNAAEAKAYFASQPFINPPIKTLKPTYLSKQVDANQGGTYVYENGSTVVVPAAAFVNGQGNLVEGPVEIKYREFHDYVDFFISGIPMNYDSMGTSYHLESAGMIEIYAEQNGERLEMNPGKELDIKLIHDIYAAPGDPLDFNIYHLDTDQRNWVYKGKNNLEIIPNPNTAVLVSDEDRATENFQTQLNDLEKEQTQKIAKIEATIPKPIAPIAPAEADQSAHVFNLKFTEDNLIQGEEFTEGFDQSSSTALIPSGNAVNDLDQQRAALRDLQEKYKNLLWQVAPNQPDFNEKAASSINWMDMKLRKLNNRDYELTLIGSANQMKVTVNPVLTGADFQSAMAEFNQSFAQYETDLANREAQLKSARETLLREINERKRLAKMNFDKRIATLKAEGKDNKVSEEMIKHRIVNTFTATSLGIWNCDRPLPPWLVRLNADFKNEQQESFNSNVAFLADQTKNTVAKFYAKKGTEVQYNRNSKKLMWVVTKENKLAVYRPEKFSDIDKKQDSHTFVLDVIDRKIETEEDIREILQF